MEIKIVGDTQPSEKEVKSPDVEVRENPIPQLQHNAIAQVMGLDDPTEQARYRDKIDTLLQYAKTQTDNHSLENLKWAVRSLELSLGAPPLSEKRINYVARYAYLRMERGKIDRELEKMTKAGL